MIGENRLQFEVPEPSVVTTSLRHSWSENFGQQLVGPAEGKTAS